VLSFTTQAAYRTFELERVFGRLSLLERLEFVQQLFKLEETSPTLHRQRMEVDFIRLIEEKEQQN
jgi:hypothetical protein